MTPLLRWLGRTLLVFYVLVAIVVLGVRYWLLPHIDLFNAPIAQALSTATASQIRFGKIHAKWHGLMPELRIDDLQIQDRTTGQKLTIPHMDARLKWRSLWAQQPIFSYLRIDGLSVDLSERSTSNGRAVAPHAFMNWLMLQERVEINSSQLLWHNRSRANAPLALTNVHGVLHYKKQEQLLHYTLDATAQVGLGENISLRGYLQPSRELMNGSEEVDGLMYVQINELNPAVWRSWLDIPADLTQATIDAQLWLQIESNQIKQVSIDSRIYNGVWQSDVLGQFKARSVRVFASGPWEGFQALSNKVAFNQYVQTEPFHFELYAQQAQWENQSKFTEGLGFDVLSLVLKRSAKAPHNAIQIENITVKNEDFNASISGSWTPVGSDLLLGEFDLLGRLEQVQLASLYQYFPVPEVSASLVDWLQQGVLKGELPYGVVRIKGNAAQFPYGQLSVDEAAGSLFYVGGAFTGAQIDYYPESVDLNEKGWPKLEQAQGSLIIRGNALWVNNAQAILRPDGKTAVNANDIRVHIDSFEADEPILTVDAHTYGAAQAYLGLMSTTDLGSWLDHTFDSSTATGQWQVPLALRVNLEDEDDVQVKGHIDFDKNTVELLPFLPPLQSVTGRLVFTEKDATAEKIQARWLTGPIDLSQTVGQAGQFMQLKGEVPIEALLDYGGLGGVSKWLEGGLSYEAQIGFDKEDHFYLTAKSDLNGLSSTLPTPFAKKAQSVMPLRISWQARNPKQHQLAVELNQNLQMLLVESTATDSFFSQASLGLNDNNMASLLPSLPPTGFAIDIKQEKININDWTEIFSVLTSTPQIEDTNHTHNTAVFPSLAMLRVKADQVFLWGAPFDQATYTLQQPKPRQWRMDMSSSQAAGTVNWRTNSLGAVEGSVDAQLHRLHWQPKKQAATARLPAVEESLPNEMELPSLNLSIQDLRVAQWRLGKLRLQAEKTKNNAAYWHIPVLSLQLPEGELSASGGISRVGPQRGLKLSAQMQSTAVGAMLQQSGLKDVLVGGQGSAQVQIEWQGFPWIQTMDGLDMVVDLDLHDGRLNQIHSRTAKLLEFLSLQSLSRLTKLDLDLRGVMKDGFPFDDMKGQLRLKDNTLSTDNFRVIGPVGTIMIEGTTDIAKEQVDLRAVVVPNVDMSGAAIAAGIALNPVIGISAFITQLLFKAPLAKAMTVQYQLLGPWSQFEATELPSSP